MTYRHTENKLVQYGTAKQKIHTPWLRTEKIEIEKGRHMGKNGGRFDCIGLEGQAISKPAD